MSQNSAKVTSNTVSTVATIDTNPNANCLYISSGAISTQTASATNAGIINTTTQTIAGAKTFSGILTASGSMVAGTTSLNNTLYGGFIRSYQSTTSSITCGDGYWMIAVGTLSAGITVTLPATPTNGREIVIKDVNGSCNTYRIAVSGNGKNIDGFGASFLMASNYESKTFIYTGTIWSII